MSEEKEYEDGDAFAVSPYTSMDRVAAAAAADQSVLDQQRQLDAFSKTFGARSVSPDRPSRPKFLDKRGKGALRSHPYQPKPFSPEFFYRDDDDGSEYLKAAMQCAPGHVPDYDNSVPFLMYTNKPSEACLKNGLNKYLSWDSDKGKYCCQANPDTSEKIMEKSLQNIERMVSGVAINWRSYGRLENAITKYLIHFSLLNRSNPDLILKKQIEMKDLIQMYKTDLTTDKKKEARSKRRERATPLTLTEANELWGSTHGALSASSPAEPSAIDLLKKGGGRSRVKRNRSKRNRSKRNRSKRNRSKRNRSKRNSRRNKNNK